MASEPAEPRHRRARPRLLPWLAGPVLLTLAAWWGLSQMSGPTGRPAADPAPTPSDGEYHPNEQSEVPGEPVGDARGTFTMWIPRIDTHPPVVAITSDADRVLLPPRDPLLGGWWRDGARPGDEYGSVVIVGHAVESGESAFNDIPELEIGDAIYLRGDGVEQWYRVSAVDVMPRADLAADAEDIFAQDVPGRLVIVTCDDWDGTAFRSNVVVTAE